jgi:probable HAF family extracellular repeat protein
MSQFFPARYFASASFAGLLLASLSHAAEYRITDLGVLGDPYVSSIGRAVNSNGLVAGYSISRSEPDPNAPPGYFRFTSHAFLYDGVIHDIGTLGGDSSYAQALNDAGAVVGHSLTATSEFHAYLYDGMMHDLGTLGGAESFASGINDNNQVAGTSDIQDGSQHAFLYDGSLHDLGTLGGRDSAAVGINDSGLVVGASETTDYTQHAFLYDGTMHDLGTLDGTWSRAIAINSIAHVTGTAGSGFSGGHGFFYDGVMHDMGDLGGGYSEAWAINASDTITGQSETADGSYDAFLYTPQSGMLNLNSLIEPLSGWSLAMGSGINNAGQITGWGYIGGQEHAFLLTPLPEPAAFALASVAVLNLLTVFRRRRELETREGSSRWSSSKVRTLSFPHPPAAPPAERRTRNSWKLGNLEKSSSPSVVAERLDVWQACDLGQLHR